MHHHHHFALRQLIFLSCFALFLLIFFPVGGVWDQQLIHPWMDIHGQFPLKNAWALASLNHHYVKNLLIVVYVIFLILWLYSFNPQATVQQRTIQRWQYGYLFLMVIISTALIGVIKSQSAHACPWSMTIATTDAFMWDFSAKNGHCFPGGHASTGFALFAGYFAYRLTHQKLAYFYLIAALILGFAMGFAQMMRGAHFFSHHLWTAWIIWAVNCLAYWLCCFYLSIIVARRCSLANRQAPDFLRMINCHLSVPLHDQQSTSLNRYQPLNDDEHDKIV